jgi:hypothetical protein
MMSKELNEDELWGLIDKFNWSLDHDYVRIRGEIGNMDLDVANQLHEFAYEKQGKISSKYREDWLGEPGIDVSDDGWSDLTAEVVGQGKEFYNNITVEKLQTMANSGTYYENFMYSFNQ